MLKQASNNYDERQLKERHRAGFHALLVLLFLVFANGVWKSFFGEWTGPLNEALIFVMLSMAVFAFQTILRDAQFGRNEAGFRVFIGIACACLGLWCVCFLRYAMDGSFILIEDGKLTNLAAFVIMALCYLFVLMAALLRRYRNRLDAQAEDGTGEEA